MSTTTRNQTANLEAIRRIPPNGPGGTGGGGVNRPGPSPTGPAPLVGDPEFIPQHTFISVAMPHDNGFIANAVHFHENVGLNPRSVGSLEEILELLGNAAETGTAVLDRIRIVSHFFVADGGEAEQVSNMGMKLLRDGGRGVLRRHLEGFAQSSIEGLRSLIEIDLPSNQTSLTVCASDETVVLAALRAAGQGAAVDAVFPPSQLASAEKNEFVIICGAKWILAHPPAGLANAAIRADLDRAYDILIADLRTRLIAGPDNVPAAALDTLASAIAGLASIANVQLAKPGGLPRYGPNVSAALTAHAGDAFRSKVLAARRRCDRFTTIDIRGCQAGRDIPYLEAIQRFFGQSDTVRPVVTAPNIFQRFNQIAAIEPFGTNPPAQAAALNALFNSAAGAAPYLVAQVRDQFVTWADGFGIDGAHLTFWHTTFQLSVLQFSALGWRAGIPPRRVVVPRLDALATVTFADVFARLGEIFFIANSSRPTAAQLTALAPLLANLGTWIAQLDAPVASGSSAAQLSTHFNGFRTIYEAVDSRMANPAFHNSPQRVIPPVEPPGLTAAQTTAFQTALRNFIQTNNSSRFAPVRKFLTAADAQTQDAPARMRYFLALGLVFQLAHDTNVSFGVQHIVVLNDRTATNNRRDEAIRHWMRAAWRGVAPPTISPTVTYDLGRHSAWIVADHEKGPSHVCPHPSYMAHIVTQPA
jgi:hypothetical protein